LSYLGQDLSIQGIMLGQKLKELREEHQFVQREVAAKLEVDTAYVSKMENGTKQVSRSWLPILADMFKVQESELVTLWIADKIDKIIIDESCGAKALELIAKKYTNQ
jgi:HTH-type transcriptional regulator, competence development regulator